MDDEISEEDTFKILIATDNHLGYQERDAIRGNDSMNTFEEILYIAKEKAVDFILLGGDLFHENKPSRKCVHSCMTLLRKYCMGDNPVQYEFLSDQSVNFKHNSFPVVNYEDPNLNVSIPVFSIHGNHDDPAGSGSLCALDLLSVSGLVNYFGKHFELKNIQISPLLMQKGATKLALYGLGSIRDERLHRLFKEGNISMLRPKQDTEDWFNIFVIHQNRAQHGVTNCIPGNFLDDFLDLVIWGHEHECRLTPEYMEWSNHQGFYISQPGSSIATSLSPGEAVPKHVGLLQVNRKSFKMQNIPLKTVRPFFIENVFLSNSGLNVNSPDITSQVMEYCKEKVEALIEKAHRNRVDEQEPEQPLIRLKVEYTDQNEIFNTHRFGQLFLNKVANPKDIILFSKKRRLNSKDKADFDKEQFDAIADAAHMDKIRVEDLIKEYFSSLEGDFKLSLLSDIGLNCAVKEYVDKEEKDAIEKLVNFVMEKARKHLQPLEITSDSIDLEISRYTDERNQHPDIERTEIENTLAQSRKGRTNSDKTIANDSDNMDTDEDETISPTNAKGKGTRGRGARSRGRATRGSGSRGGRAKSSDFDNDLDISTSSHQGTRGKARGASRGRGTRGKKNTLDVFLQKTGRNGNRTILSDSEEEEHSSRKQGMGQRNVFEISDSE